MSNAVYRTGIYRRCVRYAVLTLGGIACVFSILFASACNLGQGNSTPAAERLSPTVEPTREPPTSTPTNTFEPLPTATATQLPTSTPVPTETPTIRPTSTRKPTATPTATSTWDRYKPGSLASIVEATEPDAQSLLELELDNVIVPNFGHDYASKVQVIYTGEFRDVSKLKLFLIVGLWGQRTKLEDEEIEALFKTEGRFIEGDTEYWLPIQSQLIPYMKDEVQEGGKVTVLLTFAGMTKASGQIERVFLINNFLTP